MENNEKIILLKKIRDFIPYLVFVMSATVVKIALYRSKGKKITRERMLFVTFSSLFVGVLTGAICSMFKTNWLSYLAVSAATLASEGIIEVFVANSKSTALLIWDKAVGTLLSWIDNFKKKQK